MTKPAASPLPRRWASSGAGWCWPVLAAALLACESASSSGTRADAGPAADLPHVLTDTTPRSDAVAPRDASPDTFFLDALSTPDRETGGSGGQGGDLSVDAGTDAGDARPPDSALPTACRTPADCDDGFFCNGYERCQAGRCYGAAREPCADEVPCTHNLCDEENELCTQEVDDTLCPAGQICDQKVGC